MTIKIKELPDMERPYEKLKMYGEKYLSNAELLAIIIKTGTKEETAVNLAQRVLSISENNNLSALCDISIEELMKIKGIGEVKAIQIKALCEFAKRITTPFNFTNIKILRSEDVFNIFKNELGFEKREVLKVILLNSKNIVQKIIDISIGGLNDAHFDVKYVFQDAIKMGFSKIILVHNHPSGDPTPSMTDCETTKRLIKISEILNIQLLDHVIITKEKYESILSYMRRNNM